MKPCTLFFTVAFLLLWVEVKCATTKSKMTKQGLCPKPNVLRNSTSSCDNKCFTDENCTERLKCCDTGCGLQCVYGVRRGFCPNNDLPPTEGETEKPKCVSDFDCINPTKCCDRGSSKDCMPASKEKPGRCPDGCKSKSEIPCSTDYDCPDKLKCCSKWCNIPETATHAYAMN